MSRLIKSLKHLFSYVVRYEKKSTNFEYLIFLNGLKYRITNKRREAFYGYLFIGIWVIGFLWLTAYPLSMSLQYSFSEVIVSGERGTVLNFIGFANYIQMVDHLDYLFALRDFLYELAMYLPIILIVSMSIAILLNRKMRFRGFFRSIYFLPVIIASGPIITTLLGTNTQEGLLSLTSNPDVTAFLEGLLPPLMSDFVSVLFSHLVRILWYSGVQIILFLAGLQKINKEIYEAAQIDGASPWESFWKITLPSLKSIILVSSIYTIVMLSSSSTNGVLTIINQARNSNYGYASALAWVYFLTIGLILGILTLLLSYEKKSKEVVMLRRGVRS